MKPTFGQIAASELVVKKNRHAFSSKMEEMFKDYEAGKFLGWVTMRLAATLENAMTELSEKDSVALQQEVLLRVYIGYKKFLGKKPGADRARLLHKAIDRMIEEMRRDAPQVLNEAKCSKGCSACCHFPVDVNDDEVALLAELVRAGKVIDMDRLRRQAAILPADYHKAPLEDRRCVFLADDGACGIYENRPINCRKFFVKSDPQFCREFLNKIDQIIVGPWEELASSSANLSAGGINLSKGLLAALDNSAATPMEPGLPEPR